MRRSGTTTFEGKSGYGLDHDTELAQLEAVRAAGGVPTWLGAHALPPEFDDRDAYIDFLLADVLPAAAQIAEAADVFLERGAFDAAQARRYLRGLRCGRSRAAVARRPVHGERGDPARRSSSARAPSTISRRRAPQGARTLAASAVTGVLLPASALFLDRPMPPARALARRRRRDRARHRLQPGQRLLREPAARLLARLHAAPLAPEEALAACTVNAAHVLGRGDRLGRIAPGFGADLVLLDAADWRHLAYHLGGDVVHTVIEGGSVAFEAAGIIDGWPRESSGAAARRTCGTTTRSSTSITRATRSSRTKPRPRARREGAALPDSKSAPRRRRASARRGRAPQPPSWRRVAKRGALFAPLFVVTVVLLGGKNASIQAAVFQTLVLLVFFVPFSYFLDSLMWRSYEKKQGRGPAPKR